MSNVNGYFAAPPAPMAPPALPAPMMPYGAAGTTPPAPGAWPTPVVVPVNNAPGYTGTSDVDSYIQSAAAAAPFTAGVMPGKKAASLVAESFPAFGRRVTRSGARSTGRTASKTVRARSGVGQSGGGFFAGVMGAIKTSVIVNGLFSLAINGYQVYSKKQTMAQGGANFSGDLMSAVVGGAAGGVASAAGTAILCSAFGMTAGLPLTLIGIGLGVVGYMVGDTFLKNTKIYNDVKTKVHSLLI